MPTNLNALIRYKTINDCLSAGRGYTKKELAEACTKALAYYRKRKEEVATRTIEEDIKTMRGSELGMEAPIVNRDGMYFYSDRSYHLARVLFTDEGLIRKTINTLVKLLEIAYDEDTEKLIDQLKGILVSSRRGGQYYYMPESSEETLEHGIPGFQEYIRADSLSMPRRRERPAAGPTWGDLFSVISKGAKAQR